MKAFRISYDFPPMRGIYFVDCMAESEEQAKKAFDRHMEGEGVRFRDIREVESLGNVRLNTEVIR